MRLFTALCVLVIWAAFVHTINSIQVETQRQHKEEIAKWQRASMPVIRARGWENRYKVETLTPWEVTVALDPCRDREGFLVETLVCDQAIAAASSYGSRGIPIKIELADVLPQSKTTREILDEVAYGKKR